MGYDLPTRRSFLKTGAMAGGGFILSLRMARAAEGPATAPQMTDPPTAELQAAAEFEPNAFLQFYPDGKIVFISPHTEFGQGIYTSTAMLMCEELDLGLDQIQIEPAPPDLAKYADPLLGDQATGGSTSTRADWQRLRQAAATARAMLVTAAARSWNTEPQHCTVARGVISDGGGRSVTYGAVALRAAALPTPQNVTLKDRSQYQIIGTKAPRLDIPAKVNGSAVFGIDAQIPNMKIGTVAITPARSGKVAAMDVAAAKRVKGVADVVKSADGKSVAVFGDHMWAAIQGMQALAIQWDPGSDHDVTTEMLVDNLDQASQHRGIVATDRGHAHHVVSTAATKLEEVYQLPFLAHAPMEPLNCTLHIQPGGAEVWVGTQVPVRAQDAVAKATGLPKDQVKINNLYIGGAFGRRLDIDSITVAAELAKQVSYPVKLIWTREVDMRHDYYRPYYYDRVSGGLDAKGNLIAWTHRVTGSSVMARWAPAGLKPDGLDPDAVECAAETPYDVPAAFVDYVRHEPRGVGTGWWRGVGPTHNLFVVESFVDELAAAAKQDPVEFRRKMLKGNPRALAVLNLAAEKSGWGGALPAGHGRGIELQNAFGSFLSCVMQVEVTPQHEILLHRAVVAIDCGDTVNPDTVAAQIQGGLILGLGTALYNQITLSNGAVNQSNFHDYRTLRINEAPVIEVYQIHNQEKPGGIGETGTAAAAPALGNAIFAATGKRLRRLPFGTGQLDEV
jgi:isoquinoline 1-oxidoreductase beta subunit